eukprot:Sspe_Gene.104597::Locus_81178_Transcript_1_1_Confidence_1.000_Length_641::g.104597::m.104597
MHEGTLRALRGAYGSAKRRFAVAGAVGEPIAPTNGVQQGCPLSVILLNCIGVVWAGAVEAEGAMPMAYADDEYALAKGRAELQLAANVTAAFLEDTDQEACLEKTVTFSAGAPGATGRIMWKDGGMLRHTRELKVLGAAVFPAGRPNTSLWGKRWRKAKSRLRRLARLPLTVDEKGTLVMSHVVAQVGY